MGCSRLRSACSGLRLTGALRVAHTASTKATGGPHVGFYGGVNYGFGYGGVGFVGGRWNGGVFAYNTAVARVGIGGGFAHNTYVDRNVVVNNTIINNNHTSFNGGPNGINVHASAQEQAFSHENHIAPTANQQRPLPGRAAEPCQLRLRQWRPSAVCRVSAPPAPPRVRSLLAEAISTGPGSRDGFGTRNEVNTRQGNQQARINQGRQIRPNDARRNAQPRKSRQQHQPSGAGRPRSQRRQPDQQPAPADQPAAEQRQ